jgi:hypothetical protein
MSVEAGAPPPPDRQPVEIEQVGVVGHYDVGPARPAKQFDATTAIIPGPPPGTTTYRLRATETSQTD